MRHSKGLSVWLPAGGVAGASEPRCSPTVVYRSTLKGPGRWAVRMEVRSSCTRRYIEDDTCGACAVRGRRRFGGCVLRTPGACGIRECQPRTTEHRRLRRVAASGTTGSTMTTQSRKLPPPATVSIGRDGSLPGGNRSDTSYYRSVLPG